MGLPRKKVKSNFTFSPSCAALVEVANGAFGGKAHIRQILHAATTRFTSSSWMAT